MNWNTLKDRWTPARQTVTRGFVLPAAVVEIQPDFVTAAKLDAGQRQVRRMAVAELEPGAVNPHPGRPNVAGESALRQAVERVTRVIGAEGGRAGRLGLLLSDGAVRVAILPFDTVPDSREELETLVRWQMKDQLPFPPEEARLTCQISRPEKGGFEVLALAARSSVLGEYESALKGAGDGLLLPTTAALLPLLPAESGVGQLLVSVCSGWITTVLVQGSRVCAWRTKEMIEVLPEEQRMAVATEAGRVAASARDHLSVEIGLAWLCARPAAPQALEREVSRAVGREVRALEPTAEAGGTLPAAERASFERYGAPLAGLLMNAA